MPTALAYASKLLLSLPALIQAGIEVVDLIETGNKKLAEMQTQQRDPTTEEWDALNASIADKHARIQS